MSLLPLALLLLCCICSAVSAVTVGEVVSSELGKGEPTPAMSCDANSTTRLKFVTSLSIGGCPLFVHRLGEVKAGQFVLEPIFCITDTEALTQASVHYDPLTNQSYFSFPVIVTDDALISEVQTRLSHLSPKSISFLKVTDIRLGSIEGAIFKAMGLIWDPTENVGHLRISCDGLMCQSAALHLWSNQFELLDSRDLVATLEISEGCAPVGRTYAVVIAHAPFLPIKMTQRRQALHLRTCSYLHLFRVVQLDNCTAFVHQKQSKKGHFVIEPLLCPTAKFSLLTDYSLGRHYLKLPATVEDSVIADAVKSRLASASPQSIEFMKLWDASIHVTDRLSQWQIQPLRLSADRKAAELRVYCANLSSCELLNSVLEAEPVNFWRNVKWTATSVLADECEFKSSQRRFAFRMRDTEKRGSGQPMPSSPWSIEALRKRRVSRDGRNFVVVQQRSCGPSNFQRLWAEYVDGFGDDSNFWLGLKMMHALTSPQGTTLRVEMRLWNDTEWFAEYSAFTVGNASTKYAMNYADMKAAKSSLIFDAMKESREMPFSTQDVDNYGYSSRGYCSTSWAGHSGWWFKGCSHANPNGRYHYGETAGTPYTVWHFLEGFKSLKEFRMMLQI